jgi:hypothetical protein
MLARMGRLRDWLERRTAAREQDALALWSRERDGAREPADAGARGAAEDAPDALPMPPDHDWTVDPTERIPPWRRNDRALIDAARAAAAAEGAHAPTTLSPLLVRDLRRLADLHADAALSDGEFVAAVRARLAAEPER